jgi:Trypsin
VEAPYYPDLSDPTDLSPTLIGGTVADPADWPASPWVGNCSSTLIGERTLMTAAHCVSNGGSKSFTIGSTRYTGSCTHHPSYRGNATADWALCYLSQAVAGVKFESIATSAEASCDRGDMFLWTGYGCQRWGGGIDGRFRVGQVAATNCPSGTNYDTITRGSVALCSGDSGGGGYVLLAGGVRKVVGVNSRSNTTDTSYVSSVYTTSFRQWAETWGDGKSTKICGIHADTTNCRSDNTPPPDDDCGRELATVMTTLSAHETATNALKACLEAR